MLPHLNKTSPSPEAPEQLVDLKKLLHVILRFKWHILIFAVVCSALAAAVAMNMAPVYRSTATLLIEAQQARAIKIEEVYGFNSSQQEYYLTQFEIIKSRSVAERVFDHLELAGHDIFQRKPSLSGRLKSLLPAFSAAEPATTHNELAEALKRKRQLDAFAANIQVTPVRKTQLVNISYFSTDPKLAQMVANAVGDAYIESQLDAKLGITQKANTWLGGRLGELRERLEQSERKLEDFRAKHNLVDVEGVTALDARELERLNDEITDARSRKAKADGFLVLVQHFGQQDVSKLESLPEITSHPSVQSVKREVIMVERKVSELSKVYGPKHPRMIGAQAELVAVNNSLHQQITRLIEGIEKEAQTSAQRLTALEQQFNDAKQAFSGLGSIATDYRRLQREVETNQLLFDSFFARQKETEVTGDFDAPVARFTDRAILPSEPVKPRKKFIVMLAFFAASGFAMLLVIAFDAFNDTIKSQDDAEQLLAQRVLGFLPKADKKLSQQQKTFAYFDQEQRMHSEAVRNVRTAISLMALDKPLQLIEVTSSSPEEGKTTVSTNLAFAFSSLERVLLVDADMRKPSLAARFKLPAYQPGLANVLAGTERLEHCIVKNVHQGIDLLPAGAIPLNPLELLAGTTLQGLLEQLRSQYDKIIIDTPPVHAVSDPLVLAPVMDAVVLVVRAEHTRRTIIQQTLGQLHQAHAKVFGVVLNQMKITRQGYYGHYGYYGETPEQESR
ncbi:polysaccharide biosynthesis tyrosine autokinase [Chromatiaceae bacterium AAb-1]|nr:polysaccharide biosynthesis tyrosine autokinase [Chromatiaceae bacterium AAb-1]